MVAKEKHAGVGDQVSRRPGELLTNKKFPSGFKHYSAENQGHNSSKSVYKEAPGTSQEGLGETHAKRQRHGKKMHKKQPPGQARMGPGRVSGNTEQRKSM